MNSNSISSLPIRSIKTDHTIQQRAKLLDNGIVAEYSEAMQAGSQFPPIIVYHDGSTNWLADGYHRLEAADEAGKKTIAAEIREGTKRDATLCACAANRDHGLRRTRADVRRAITTLVTDAEWMQMANRAIAEMVGCSDKTVASVREELVRCGNSAPGHSDQDAHPTTQVEKFTTSTTAVGDEPRCGNYAPEDTAPIIEEMEGDDLAGIRQATARMKGDAAPPPPAKAPPAPVKRTGRDGKSYPAAKAKPAPKPAPTVNKAKLAMQAAHGVAAALTALERLETDLLREDAEVVMANLRTALARLEDRFGLGGMEVKGHA